MALYAYMQARSDIAHIKNQTADTQLTADQLFQLAAILQECPSSAYSALSTFKYSSAMLIKPFEMQDFVNRYSSIFGQKVDAVMSEASCGL